MSGYVEKFKNLDPGKYTPVHEFGNTVDLAISLWDA